MPEDRLGPDLARELQGVMTGLPVPPDLLPTERLRAARRDGGNRRRIAAAAVATVVLLAVVTTGTGRSAVEAAAGWLVMQYRVQVYEPWDGASCPGHHDEDSAPARARQRIAGQTYVVPYTDCGNGFHIPHMVVRHLRLGDLLQDDPSWPVPTYLRPDEDEVVVLQRLHDRWGRPTADAITVMYDPIPDDARPDIVLYSLHRAVPGRAFRPAGPEARAVRVPPTCAPEQRQVSIRGQAATVFRCGKHWELRWRHEGGSGQVITTLGLEELVRLVESLPSMR